MIPQETVTLIRNLFYAEHWKIGTIASELGLHYDTVRRAVEADRFSRRVARSTLVDPYADFVRETLARYPRLRATRIFQMLQVRGYTGSVNTLRRAVADLRPSRREAFLRLRTFPGDQGQVDWAHFGKVKVGRAQRRLSCFVSTLSYSRALYLEFFFDQMLESFLRGHVRTFQDWGGVPRNVLSGRGNEKGRVERAIQYVRGSFFAARPFTTLEDFNRQALRWRDEVAHRRPWPGDDSKTVEQAFEEEKPCLLPLPANPFNTDLVLAIRSGKTIYVRFDLNDYSIPPTYVGRPLTLLASDTTVRILDGQTEVARHRRSYDRHEFVTDPAHEIALLKGKRKARGSTPGGSLASAVPESEEFLNAAFQRGESAASQTAQLLRLLDDYGATELRAAIGEALMRNTPRASSVAFILNKRRRASRRRPPTPVDLSRRPDLADVNIQPHNPETYDELSHNDDDDSEQ